MLHLPRRRCLQGLAAGFVVGVLPARAQAAAVDADADVDVDVDVPVAAPVRMTSMTSPEVPMSFELRPGSQRDLQHDREAVRIERVLPASPRRIFAMLGAAEPWPQWLKLVKEVAYLDDVRGIGCERDVKLLDDSVIREHFIAWSQQRVTFYASRSSSPALSFFMEDFVMLPVTGGKTRLRWSMAYELRGAYGVLAPAFGPVFQQQAEAGLDRLEKMLG